MSGIRATVRWPAFAIAGVFLVGLIGAAIFFLMPDRKTVGSKGPLSPSASASAAREQRASVVTDVAPAPLPTALPLIGGEGTEADGYPKAHVNRPALRTLLWLRKFAELDRYFTEFEDAFEKDPRKEYWPLDAADAFSSAEEALGAPLDAWVRASPGSFAPYFARSAHLLGRALAMRGEARAKDTPQSNFDEMEKLLASFHDDADRAIALRPKLVAEMRFQIRALNQTSERSVRDATFARANAICPTCFQVRVAEIIALTPRWGGSVPEMRAFAARCDATENPRCKFLEGYVDWDVATLEEDADRGLVAIDRALTHGEFWPFLVEKARLLIRKKDYAGASAICAKAKLQEPSEPEVLGPCLGAEWGLEQWEDAARDLLQILRTDPTDDRGRANFDGISNNIAWAAHDAQKHQRDADALRLFELALDLQPSQPHLIFGRSTAKYGPANDVPSLEANVAQNPDDLRAHQALDYTLAKQAKFDRVLEIWTAYLARHPDDARAYFERSGAYYHQKRWPECRADAQRACDSGIAEACGQLARLPK